MNLRPRGIRRVENFKREGHPLESGCPIGKWEEVRHARTPVPC